ncbi:MAG: zinc ABC transporter substrate-binding protein [Bacteroidales bacterium]|nr:zinc ABC transporter substrate-binding protein [Bacteroidales bacterium]MDT8430235.1 zinc ABC transporter substrate-binding protein [Bacteroidales bacterium]
MRKTTALVLTSLVAAAMLLVTSCGNKPGNDDQPTIAVSILPQEYFVSRIAGDLFSINVMIPPGASPATYEPTPAQLAILSKTDLYLKMGYTGFEMAWMDKLRSANQQMTIVNLSEGLHLITEATMHGDPADHEDAELHADTNVHGDTDVHSAIEEHAPGEEHAHYHGGTEEHSTTDAHGDMEDHGGMEAHEAMAEHGTTEAHEAMADHGHHHGGIDPHTWLSPKNVKIIARNIHNALAAAYPEHKEVFAANLDEFMGDLDSLDSSIANELKDLSSRAFFTYHPSLSYFARDYNLAQYPLELGGKSPSAAHMKKMIDTGREKRIGIVFLQMQFDQKNAEVLAKEIGAEIVQINPLEPEWYDQMLYISGKLKENLH